MTGVAERRVCIVLLLVLVLAVCLTAYSAATAHASSAAPDSSARKGSAACPVCVIGAAAVVRGAIAISARSAGRAAVRVGGTIARTSPSVFNRPSVSMVRSIQREARRIRSRGSAWMKRSWPTLKHETKVCLGTIAFMEAGRYWVDHKLTRNEWTQYAVFGPNFGAVTEFVALPIHVEPAELAKRWGEEAVSCAVGLGVAKAIPRGKIPPPE